jgi:hypothetical protein
LKAGYPATSAGDRETLPELSHSGSGRWLAKNALR